MIYDIMIVAAFLFPIGVAVACLVVLLGWVRGVDWSNND